MTTTELPRPTPLRAAPEPPPEPAAGIADVVAPLARRLLGPTPTVGVRFWDGSEIPGTGRTTIVVRSPRVLTRMLYAPGELGLGRAFVAGELDVEGSIADIIDLRDQVAGARTAIGPRALLALARAAVRAGAIGLPPSPPPEEARLHGRRHTRRRDSRAVRHHYDVGNDFYRLFLGETMTYSCAYWTGPNRDPSGLDAAQIAKYELVCRKLGLRPGMRLLDVGCGWGGMVIHAARHFGVEAVGITLSPAQCELARQRVAAAGLSDRVEIRVQDYRELPPDERFDAISSIGMFEHVGRARTAEYFTALVERLPVGGRLLNHAITRRGSGPLPPRSFLARYVFPDGELLDLGDTILAMHAAGLEVRDVESLREHYAATVRAWVANLEASWDKAVALVGEGRARVWWLSMAGYIPAFEENRINVHQVLAVRSDGGHSGMPATRESLVVSAGWAPPPA